MAGFCVQFNAGISRNVAAMAVCDGIRESKGIRRIELQENVKNSRVLILGGTGRVGGSIASALSRFCPDLRIVIGGRNRGKGTEMVSKLGDKGEFAYVDLNDTGSLEDALNDVDLVVHTAGPFQRTEKCTVLEAAIKTKTAYLDVCDDTSYSWRAKSYFNRAVEANIPAITTGESALGLAMVFMAAELVRAAKSQGKGELERLRFYYYTAGSGGAGPTVLSTSFLLLGEDVIAYNKGDEIKLKPYSGMLDIDFGIGIGRKSVYLLNLPEVRSVHKITGVPTVSARFGSAPFFWNWGMLALTLLPQEILRDRSKVEKLVQLFDPLVRAVDGVAGEKFSMRVDLDSSDGQTRIGIFSHKRLSESVGIATAAFALSILEGHTKPGVWFPEEPEGIAVEARAVLLSRASHGTFNFVMNK